MGLDRSVEGEKQSLDLLRSKYSGELASLTKAAVEIRGEHAKQMEEFGAFIQEKREDHSNLVASQMAEHAAAFQDGEAKRKELEEIYNQRLALEAPVTYWSGAARGHRSWAIAFGVLTLASAGATLFYATTMANWLLGIPEAKFWHLAVFGAFFTLMIAGVRIFSRLMLSHLHLMTDATERTVMANTYLSLLRDKKGPKDEERQLLLQTLFRPAATGIIKEDTIPASHFEMLAKFASGKTT